MPIPLPNAPVVEKFPKVKASRLNTGYIVESNDKLAKHLFS